MHKENDKFVAPWFGSHSQFITFMVKPYYIYGCSVCYIYGQILLQLWLVVLLHLWLKVITFMVSITFMVNFYYIYGWYYIYGFYYIYGWYSCDLLICLTSYKQWVFGLSFNFSGHYSLFLEANGPAAGLTFQLFISCGTLLLFVLLGVALN